jgi:hypothetical protein
MGGVDTLDLWSALGVEELRGVSAVEGRKRECSLRSLAFHRTGVPLPVPLRTFLSTIHMNGVSTMRVINKDYRRTSSHRSSS